MKATYHVTWTLAVEAHSAEAAARYAREQLRAGHESVNVLDVRDCATGEGRRIDLDELHNSHALPPGPPPDAVESLDNLRHAARRVCASWESGDLAGAVNDLESLLPDED